MLIIKWHVQNYLEMKTKEQVLNLLGLAQRARKLTSGEQQVLKEIRNGKAKLVFFASNGGAASLKKISDKCDSYGVHLNTDFNREELSAAIGSKRSIVAVADPGFSKKMKSLLVS